MTLTEAAHWTKRFGVIGGVGMGLLIIIAIVLIGINAAKDPTDFLTSNYACTEKKEERN